MRILVMAFVLFASMMQAHTTRGAEVEDIEKVRLYLTSKYDGLKNRNGPYLGPFLGETEAIKQVKIPELENFLPQTKFFVTRITTGQTCFLYAPIVVSVTPQKMDHDLRSSYSPMYTTPNGEFLDLFTQLPTKNSKEKNQLVTGIGKLYAELMPQGEAKDAVSNNKTAKIELWTGTQLWRTIKIQFDKKGISKSVLFENRFRIKKKWPINQSQSRVVSSTTIIRIVPTHISRLCQINTSVNSQRSINRRVTLTKINTSNRPFWCRPFILLC